MAEIAKLKTLIDAYGVAVRAGLVTPQTADEEYFRSIIGLPEMSGDAREDWAKTDNIRKPITLAGSDETIEINADSDDAETPQPAQVDND